MRKNAKHVLIKSQARTEKGEDEGGEKRRMGSAGPEPTGSGSMCAYGKAFREARGHFYPFSDFRNYQTENLVYPKDVDVTLYVNLPLISRKSVVS